MVLLHTYASTYVHTCKYTAISHIIMWSLLQLVQITKDGNLRTNHAVVSLIVKKACGCTVHNY